MGGQTHQGVLSRGKSRCPMPLACHQVRQVRYSGYTLRCNSSPKWRKKGVIPCLNETHALRHSGQIPMGVQCKTGTKVRIDPIVLTKHEKADLTSCISLR
eukprot:1161396-Pelagomonas_calceolata.AAC.9